MGFRQVKIPGRFQTSLLLHIEYSLRVLELDIIALAYVQDEQHTPFFNLAFQMPAAVETFVAHRIFETLHDCLKYSI